MEDSIKSIVGGITYVRHYSLPLFKALVVPVLIMSVLVLLSLIPDAPIEVISILDFLQWIPLTLIAVTTHRIIIQGPDSVPEWGINRFGLREFKFFVYQLLIMLFMLPAAVFMFIPYVGIFVFFFITLYLISRMSLVFPSIAIGETMDFKDSWKATKNHKLMMFTVVAFFPMLIVIIEILLSLIPGLNYLVGLLSIFTIILMISTLSAAYKLVMENQIVR